MQRRSFMASLFSAAAGIFGLRQRQAPAEEPEEVEIGDTGGWTPHLVRIYAHSDYPRTSDGQPSQRTIHELRVGDKWADVHVCIGPHTFSICCEYDREHCSHTPGTPDGYHHITITRQQESYAWPQQRWEEQVLGRFRVKLVPSIDSPGGPYSLPAARKP